MACGPNCVELYSEKYDTYYCKTCNEWLESKCVAEAGKATGQSAQ